MLATLYYFTELGTVWEEFYFNGGVLAGCKANTCKSCKLGTG